MALKYLGKFPEHINDVPARDLSNEDVQAIAIKWGISLAETEGLLIKHKLYAIVPKSVAKVTEKKVEDS